MRDRAILFATLAIFLGACAGEAERDWQVAVDGRPVGLRSVDISIRENDEPADHLRLKGAWYQYGSFTWTKPVTVRLTCGRPIADIDVRPWASAFPLTVVSNNAVEFTATRPFQLSFRPEGRVGALHLFGNARDPKLPRKDAPGVIYFGPGEHERREIKVGSNETLFVDEGAVVYGHLEVQGTNVAVCGSGVISSAGFDRFKGPHADTVMNASNVTLRGVTFADPCGWMVTVRNSRLVTLDGVKVMGGRMINDDGIDIINSSDVTIRNSFVRTQDDNIALKGLGYSSSAARPDPVENIRIEGCTLWTDQANNFRIGFECDAPYMRNIVVSNVDVIASSPIVTKGSDFWSHAVVNVQPSGGMDVSGVVFRDVRVADDGTGIRLVKEEPALTWSRRLGEGRHRYVERGTVRDCDFGGITLIRRPFEN